MEELQAAGGRVAMVQLLQILRRYSSSSATRRKLTCRSRPCSSTICLRPGSEETSSSTTSSNTICLRLGPFEVQVYNCIPAVDDVDQLLIDGQWWDDAPNRPVWHLQHELRSSATTLPLTIRHEIPANFRANELIRSNNCRFKMGSWRGTQNRTCFA